MIDESELKVEPWSSKAGLFRDMYKGVKVTHQKSGVVVTCDTERSQHANRAKAIEQLSKEVE